MRDESLLAAPGLGRGHVGMGIEIGLARTSEEPTVVVDPSMMFSVTAHSALEVSNVR